MVEFLEGPGFFSSRSNLGSDISFLFAVLFSTMYLISGYQAVKKRGKIHHRMILVSMVSMFAYFIFYYKVRRLGYASFTDQIHFQDSGRLYTSSFRPILYIHFTFVCLSVFLAVYTVISGFKAAVNRDGRLVLENRRLGASKLLWSLGFIWLVVLTWWLLSIHAFSWGYRVIFLFLGYFLPAAVAFFANMVLPFSEHRHRILGRLCMASFAGLLLTSTITYSMLYIF